VRGIRLILRCVTSLVKTGEIFSCGQKALRSCPVQHKDVKCHGICRAVLISEIDSHTEIKTCSMFEKALDKVLNC
jgi:hypothetical protein